jgi:putative oxidoreductase
MKILNGIPGMNSVGLFFLRLVLGIIFIVHGSMKWGMWSNPPAQMSDSMIIIMKILSISEPLGGLALIIGFLTVFAAIGLNISMIGALIMKLMVMHAPFMSMSSTGWEFDLLIIAGLFCLMFCGPGRYSIDWAMGNKKSVVGSL